MSGIEQKLFSQKLFLASQSPRRAQLLRLMGFDFEVIPSRFDEDAVRVDDPVEHVRLLSQAKAQQVAVQVERGIVIGADTVVVLNGEILGKPRDEEEAKAMLRRLAGRSHQVYTGFALVDRPTNRTVTDYEMTTVHFRPLAEWEIERYVRTQSPFDKAGAYGIQDQSAVFADRIEGCFYNVVGFPLTRFYTAMMRFIAAEEESRL